MQTAVINFDRNGKSVSWSANYATGGMDLYKAAVQIRRVKRDPYIPLGRRTISQRADEALKGYTSLIGRQGFQDRQQAEYGARVKDKYSGKDKRCFWEKIYDFFVEEVEE